MGNLCVKNRRKWPSKVGKIHTQELYMQKNLTLFLFQLWWDLKNLPSYTRNFISTKQSTEDKQETNTLLVSF